SEVEAHQILAQFYTPFKRELESASKSMLSLKSIGFPTGLLCPECEAPLNIKVGKNDQFLGCSRYPECMHTSNYTRDEKGIIQSIAAFVGETSDQQCEKCGKPMVLKQGRYGTFFACSGYPICKNTRSAVSNNKAAETGVNCPDQDCAGKLVQRTSKRGKIFYGCNHFPGCTFAVWDKPVARNCPQCGATFLLEKSTKKHGDFLACHTKGCGYNVQIKQEKA
ncbi:MAG: topoisomerase DNA-binding C4 zinc finger domain-containing protein, partial [Desulfobacterales bacterium]